jgi:tetratricopeptide (TPR) repeat protein
MLRKAMSARTPLVRARYARRGLAAPARLDKTTQAMLLRQLYLSHFEMRRFRQARLIAGQAIQLGVLSDVLHQDAARAAFAAGDLEVALEHLRLASRRGPLSRRPFHFWTLGSALFLAHRYDEAIDALTSAVRLGARARRDNGAGNESLTPGDAPLYQGHLALAKIANGDEVADLQGTIDELASAPSGQGYGRFVLGHLAYAAGAWPAARRYLEGFVRRAQNGRTAMCIALEPEVRMARATLEKIGA